MQSINNEIWKPVVGFEDTHEVSNMGRVRSRNKILKQNLNVGGYPQVTLRAGSILSSKPVHRLVGDAFIGPLPPGMETCHNDGDKLNPRLDNLRYDTRASNSQDKRKHGHGWRGESVNTALMTAEKVREARKIHAQGGITITDLAEKFGMSRQGMSHIINRRHWHYL